MLRLFRARTLQIYVLKQFLRVFALTLVICSLFAMLAVIFIKFSEYQEMGATIGQVALLMPFFYPKIFAMAAPAAAMIAATMVFSRLTAEDELIAAQAGGAPLRVMVLPIVLGSVLLCGCCLWANQGGITWGYSTIRNTVLKLDKPDSFFEKLDNPGASLALPNETGGVVRINLLPHVTDPVTRKVRKPIHIAFFQSQQVGATVLAEDFSYKPFGDQGDRWLRLTLTGGQMLGEKPSYFREVTLDIRIPSLSSLIGIGLSRGERGWWDNYLSSKKTLETLPRRRQFVLKEAADFAGMAIASWPCEAGAAPLIANGWHEARIAAEAIYAPGGVYDQQHMDYVECWLKLANSLLPFFVAFLGIGLGLLVKKSNRLIGFCIGLLVYFLVYYPLTIIAREFTNGGRVGVWILFMPNLLMFLLGFGLCYAYERGELTALPPIFSTIADPLSRLWHAIWEFISPIQHIGRWMFSRKTDGYIGGVFVVPLLVVVLALASVYTAFDFFEHGSDTVEGVLRASDPLPGMPTRSISEACIDVVVYYGISCLSFISDILPFIVLIAGLLSIYVLIRNNEHLILKSAGLPLQRAFRPLMILTVIFSLCVTLIRETVMPSLLMHRDYLKPLVYHRTPAPTAIAMYTIDSKGQPVIFEMSEYSWANRCGNNLRVFLLPDAPGKRISSIVADRAVWDGSSWRLQTDPTRLPGEKKKVEDVERQIESSPGAAKGAPVALDTTLYTVKGESASIQLQALESSRHANFTITKQPAHGEIRLNGNFVTYTPKKDYTGGDEFQYQASNGDLKGNTAKAIVTVFMPVGYYSHPQTPADEQTPGEEQPDPVQIKNARTALDSWRGTITPAYLESDRMNNKGIMRLSELNTAAAIKPDFAVEWWKRVTEAVMGIFLLWVTIPLLLAQESRGPLQGVAWIIPIAAMYWGFNLCFAELACGGWLPTWAPLIPHTTFMVLGSRSYYWTMET
jgi:lipopolysaccharide export LptBFGC system permease protein LptF